MKLYRERPACERTSYLVAMADNGEVLVADGQIAPVNDILASGLDHADNRVRLWVVLGFGSLDYRLAVQPGDGVDAQPPKALAAPDPVAHLVAATVDIDLASHPCSNSSEESGHANENAPILLEVMTSATT
jgi:hypothetical protein